MSTSSSEDKMQVDETTPVAVPAEAEAEAEPTATPTTTTTTTNMAPPTLTSKKRPRSPDVSSSESVPPAKQQATATSSTTTVTTATATATTTAATATTTTSTTTTTSASNTAVVAAAVTTAAVSAASAAAAAQLSATMGMNGLYSLLSATAMTTNSSSAASSSHSHHHHHHHHNSSSLPTVEQVRQAALKSVQDAPPFLHLSKTDSAPQLKLLDDCRLRLKGGMRGYRMSRATHGTNSGQYYYECLVLPPPSIQEIVQALPSNTRMGPKLQAQLQQALKEEEYKKKNSPNDNENSTSTNTNTNTSTSTSTSTSTKSGTFGGHVRLGWSMRTGDLQAPVGYDKWSFAVRDIGGSKIHQSKREDSWGGEDFGPGDVVGCSISFRNPKDSNNINVPNDNDNDKDNNSNPNANPNANNHANMNTIRFYKNGVNMGQVVVNNRKKEGGVAFTVPDGVYYPAISLYMGASVQFNPGPHFIYPPPKKLPNGKVSKLQPLSDLAKRPMTVEEAIAKVQKEKAFRKPDMMQKFQGLVQTEVQILQDAHSSHRKKQVQEIVIEREARSLSITDLEQDEFYENKSS